MLGSRLVKENPCVASTTRGMSEDGDFTMSKFITCTNCSKSKSLDQFYACATCLDKKNPCCKECTKAKAKKRYQANPKPKLIASKKHYEQNKESRLAQINNWQAANVDKRIIAARLWEQKNKPERAKAKANWRKENNALTRLYSSKRRAIIQSRGIFTITAKEITQLLSKPCFYCGAPSEHIDHIVPIARGGRHSIGNLIQACAKCNQSKNKKFIMEWRIKGETC